jgi:hypothetical protein
LLFAAASGFAQEAASGIDVAATVSGEVVSSQALTDKPRDGSPAIGGFRAVLYPTWKIDDHWAISGAINVVSRPYFEDDFTSQGYGVSGRILNLNLGYSKVWKNGSVVIRAGQLSSAFGSFLLRYDDTANALINTPMQYGYYTNAVVSTLGLAGAQIDLTHGKWDGRVQFTTSSPANPRSVFDDAQYPNWTGGLGYTFRQGFRVGLSGYRGPYLDRRSRFYAPGESSPRQLPASAVGADASFAWDHWNVYGEWQWFDMTYHKIPAFRVNAGYGELRRVLHPRWYVAARAGYLHGTFSFGSEVYEAAVGFRPNTHQLIKVSYALEHERFSGRLCTVTGIQLVTQIHPLSLAWH